MRCWIAFLALAVAACSGGGNGGASDARAARIAGVWTGSHTVTVYMCFLGGICAPHSTKSVPAMGLAGSNGHIHLVSDINGDGYAGIAQVSRRKISGRLNHICDPLDGPGFLGHLSIEGDYTARESMHIEYVLDECLGRGVFNLTYHEVSQRISSLSEISGTWASADIAITVDPDGTFNGASVDGCQLSGSILPGMDPVNIYRVSMRIENCNAGYGHYVGLASVVADNPGQDILLVGGIADEDVTWFGLFR